MKPLKDYRKQAEEMYVKENKIFLAIFLGSILIILNLYFLNSDAPVVFQWDDVIFLGLGAFLLVTIFYLGNIVINTLKGVDTSNDVRKSFISSLALYDFFVVLSGIFFFLYGNYAYLITAIISIGVLYTKKPTVEKIEEELREADN